MADLQVIRYFAADTEAGITAGWYFTDPNDATHSTIDPNNATVLVGTTQQFPWDPPAKSAVDLDAAHRIVVDANTPTGSLKGGDGDDEYLILPTFTGDSGAQVTISDNTGDTTIIFGGPVTTTDDNGVDTVTSFTLKEVIDANITISFIPLVSTVGARFAFEVTTTTDGVSTTKDEFFTVVYRDSATYMFESGDFAGRTFTWDELKDYVGKTDINGNKSNGAPTFTKTEYTAEVDDGETPADAGTLVSVKAIDIEDDAITYSFVGTAPTGFAIDATSGAITLTSALSHADGATHTFDVRATANGASSDATVTITVAEASAPVTPDPVATTTALTGDPIPKDLNGLDVIRYFEADGGDPAGWYFATDADIRVRDANALADGPDLEGAHRIIVDANTPTGSVSGGGGDDEFLILPGLAGGVRPSGDVIDINDSVGQNTVIFGKSIVTIDGGTTTTTSINIVDMYTESVSSGLPEIGIFELETVTSVDDGSGSNPVVTTSRVDIIVRALSDDVAADVGMTLFAFEDPAHNLHGRKLTFSELENYQDGTPTFTKDASAYTAQIAENVDSTTAGVLVDVDAVDINSGDTLTYSFVGTHDGFAIDSSTGEITLASALDFETAGATHELTVQVTDNSTPAKSSTTTVTITLTDEDETVQDTGKAIYTIASSVDDATNRTIWTATLDTPDPDGGAQAGTISYSWRSSADDSEIGTGATYNPTPADARDGFYLEVSYTDGAGNKQTTDPVSVAANTGRPNIEVTWLAGFENGVVPEGIDTAGNVKIATLSVSDTDAADASHVFSLFSARSTELKVKKDGDGFGLFVQAGSVVDREDHTFPETVRIRIQTFDSANNLGQRTVIVTFKDINDNGPELTAAGTGAIDADDSTTAMDTGITFTISDDDAASEVNPDIAEGSFTVYQSDGVTEDTRFDVVAEGTDGTWKLVLLSGQTVTYDSAAPTISLNVAVTDGDANTPDGTATVTIAVNPPAVATPNEKPVITAVATPFDVDEGNLTDAAVGTLAYTDAESDDATFMFVDTANANALTSSITIGAATFTITDAGVITVSGDLNYEALAADARSYTLTVRATDSANNNASDDVEITVNIVDIDEGEATYSVTEQGATLTATLDTADPDGVKADTTSYQWFTTTDGGVNKTIIPDADEQNFDSSTHTLPAGALYGVTITYTDNTDAPESVDAIQSPIRFVQGGGSVTSYSIAVAENQDTTPFLTLSENNIVTVVGEKAGGTISYSFASGNDANITNLFGLDTATGALTVDGILDYEAGARRHTIKILVTYDEDGDSGDTGAVYTRELDVAVIVSDADDLATFKFTSTGNANAPVVGDTLTIAPDKADPDGAPTASPPYVYTWFHVDTNGVETEIVDDSGNQITGATYTLRDTDVGEIIRVRANYNDARNRPDVVDTDTVAEVIAVAVAGSLTLDSGFTTTDAGTPDEKHTLEIESSHGVADGNINLASFTGVPDALTITFTNEAGTETTIDIVGEFDFVGNKNAPAYWDLFDIVYNAQNEIVLDFGFSNVGFDTNANALLTPDGVIQDFTITATYGTETKSVDFSLQLVGDDDPIISAGGTGVVTAVEAGARYTFTETPNLLENTLESDAEDGVREGTMYINDKDVGDTYSIVVSYLFTQGSTTTRGTETITIDTSGTGTLDTTMGRIEVWLDDDGTGTGTKAGETRQIDWKYTYNADAGDLASRGVLREQIEFVITDTREGIEDSVVTVTPLTFSLESEIEIPAFFDETGAALATLTGDADTSKAAGEVVATFLVEFSENDPVTVLADSVIVSGTDGALFNGRIVKDNTNAFEKVTIGDNTFYKIEITWAGDGRTETADSGVTDDHFDFTIEVTNSETSPAQSNTLTAKLEAVDETPAVPFSVEIPFANAPANLVENTRYDGEEILTTADYNVAGAVGDLTYTLLDIDDNVIAGNTLHGFTLNADTGAMTYTGTPDFEGAAILGEGGFSFQVQVTDSATPTASTDTAFLFIGVENVEEGLATVTIAVQNDADVNVLEVGETLTASIDYSTDGDGVELDPTKFNHVDPTYTWYRVDSVGGETKVGVNSATYTIQDTDVDHTIYVSVEYQQISNQPNTATSSATIEVTAPVINTPPTITVSGSATVDEGDYSTINSLAITGTIDINAQDDGNSLTYRLIGTGAELFTIDGGGGIVASGVLDFETAPNTYTFQVGVSDGVNAEVISTGTITINVNDVDEHTPEFVGDLSGAVVDRDILLSEGITTSGLVTGVEDLDASDTLPASRLAYLIENSYETVEKLVTLGLVDAADVGDTPATPADFAARGYADLAELGLTAGTAPTADQLDQIIALDLQPLGSVGLDATDPQGELLEFSSSNTLLTTGGTYGTFQFAETYDVSLGFPPVRTFTGYTWTYQLDQEDADTRALKDGEVVQETFTLVYRIPAILDAQGNELVAAKTYETDVVVSVTGVDVPFSFTERSGYQIDLKENVDGVIGQVEANDPDSDNPPSVTYTFTDATKADDVNNPLVGGERLFSINGATGEISINSALDFETTTKKEYELNVFADPDDGGNKVSSKVTVRLVDVDEAPVFAQTSYTADAVAEDVVPNTVLYTFDSANELSDEDTHPREFSYSIVGGNPVVGTRTVTRADENGNPITVQEDIYLFGLNLYFDHPNPADPNFDISDYPGFDPANPLDYVPQNYGFDIVLLNGALNHEDVASHTLTIQVRDSRDPDTSIGETATVEIVIPVSDVNEHPTELTAVGTGAIEEQPSATAAAIKTGITFTVSDDDATEAALTADSFSVSDARFDVIDDGGTWTLVLASGQTLDYDGNNPTISMTVTVTDGDSDTTDHTINVDVTVSEAVVTNQPPSFGANAVVWGAEYDNGSVRENTPADSTLATITATDPDNDTLTYRIKGGSTLFEMDGDKLKLKAVLDFETSQTHALTIEVSQDGGTTYVAETTVNIAVRDIDEAPEFAESAYSFTIGKNDDLASFSQDVTATDPESATLTYSFVLSDDTTTENDQGFSINPSTGAITITDAASFARDADRTYNLRVQATDSTTFPVIVDVVITVAEGNVPAEIEITGHQKDDTDDNNFVDLVTGWTLSVNEVEADPDGVDSSVTPTYHWYHVGAEATAIGTGATYETQTSDVGETIGVRYTYTDDDGISTPVYATVGMPVRRVEVIDNPATPGSEDIEDNDITLTDEPTRVDAGDGSDTITDGAGDDVIIGGLGDDDIDLGGSGNDQDTVVYEIGDKTAQDGGDDISNFERGQDKFVFSLKSNADTSGLSTTQDFLDYVAGDTAGLLDDQFLMMLNFDQTGVKGLYIHFQDSVFFEGGRISMPVVTLTFSETIGGTEFLEDVFGDIPTATANLNSAGIVTNVDYFNALLGGDDDFEAIDFQLVPDVV